MSDKVYVQNIQGVPLTDAELKHFNSLSGTNAQEFIDNLKKENRTGEVKPENQAPAVKSTSTMKESDLPAESWKKPLQEADKAQLKEDKEFTKDTGVYVNNTSGNAVSEDKLPDILTVSGPDYHNNDNYTVKKLIKAAQKAGWTEKQMRDRLDELYPNGWSDNAKKEWENSGYAALEEKKAKEVAEATDKEPEIKKPENKPVPVVEPPEVPNKEEFDETKNESKEEPAPEVEVEPVENKEEAKEQSENIDGAIKDLEEQLANAPDEITRQELEIRLRNAKQAKELYDSMLVLTDEEIKDRYSSRSGMDDFIKRQRAGGLSSYYKREKDRLKDQLKAAKEAGDDAKVKKLEGELKELSGEKGYFIADSIETALRNLSSTYAGQAPSATSEWSKKQGDILKAETDRWNQHWNEQMEGIDADFAQKYEEDDARRAAWNDIKNNEAAQMAAKRLGLLDDTFNAQAAINLQKLFGSMSTSDALITMAQMKDYDTEDLAFFVLGRAAKSGNLNLEEIVGNLGEIVKNLGDAAGDLSGGLSDLIEYLTKNAEAHGMKFWEWGKGGK